MKYKSFRLILLFNCLDLILCGEKYYLLEDKFLMGKISIMNNVKLIEFCFLFFNYSLVIPLALHEVSALVTCPMFFYLFSLVG